jgi:hypothetical protein
MKPFTLPGALILMRKPLLVLLILLPVCIYSQKIRSEEITYTWSKLPLQPLDPSIKNYTARIEAVYEAKNKQLMEEYQAAKQRAQEKYEKELAKNPAAVKAAEARYEKEMAEYRQKSLGTKIVEKAILGENTKPVKEMPQHPYLEYVPPPALKTSYDYPVLANTYFRLNGYENNPANAVQVIITMYGFDYTQPRILSVQKDMLSYQNGKATPYKATYYHVEFSYRHPMTVKVLLPDGKELMNVTPQPLNVYKIYRSPDSEKMPQINEELMIKTNEEIILQRNLKYIDSLVNDKIGYGNVERKARIYYVKEKGDDYADLVGAFNTASSGFTLFNKDPETAKKDLQNAITAWTTALKESDPSNKKARIDKDVTIAIYFNLLETYLALGEENEASASLQKLNAMSLSSSERTDKAEFEMLFADMRKRKQNNH